MLHVSIISTELGIQSFDNLEAFPDAELTLINDKFVQIGVRYTLVLQTADKASGLSQDQNQDLTQIAQVALSVQQ